MVKAILFDLDGTLIRTEEIIMAGFRHAISKYLPDTKINKTDETNFLGQTLDNSFKKYTKDESITKSLINTYKAYTKELIEKELKTHNNAENILKYLKSKNIKLGVVTSKANDTATNDLKIVNLLNYFDVIVGFDNVKNHKPDPESLLKAAEILNIDPKHMVYVGDHENDIIAANKAKMVSVGVTYSYRFKELLSENPVYVIDDLINLEDII